MKILFVCSGNAGRSPTAEAAFNSLAAGRHEAFSAGTQVAAKGREGQMVKDSGASTANVIAAAAELGLDIGSHVRRQITPGMVDEADKIILLAAEDVPEYLAASPKVISWDIMDPYGADLSATRAVRDQIFGKVKQLIADIIDTEAAAI